MIDPVLHFLEQLMASPWVYGALLTMSFVDSIFPLFPSEAPIILAAAHSASQGSPSIVGIFLAAAVGAFIGDHLTYGVGRSLSGKVDDWPAESRRGRAVHTARQLLARRGGMALVVARFIPWGRIATSFVMGATRFPLRSYSAYDALGTGIWALHGCLLGYLGGVAFQDQPLRAMALGLGMALVASVLIEVGRRWWERRQTDRAESEASLVE